ncbi:S8 family serine peptidase [Phytomonospora sp. NPDC050363]|uniref:S8 family serine peptidase n=1 Tax=Phytomonospora sp. NPDC050363 TaxID=3155642 RepID=UPI0033CFF9B5
MAITGWMRRAVTGVVTMTLGATTLCIGTAGPVAASAPGQWWADELDLEALHQVTRGEGATIGIVDTGVDITHPDLADADISGKDIWSPRQDGSTDKQGHGTAMAALLVGQGKGGGVLGVAPDARLLIYAPMQGELSGAFYDDDYAAGIAWLVEQRVDVILLAAGTPTPPFQPEASALRAAERVGIPVVAAAGNTATAIDSDVEWPAATPGVLAVSGTKPGGAFSSASLSGPEVDVAAPADDIGSAIPPGLPGFGDDIYFTGSGTSNSSAFIAGVIGLLAARFPDASREDLLHRVTSTATDRGPAGRDEKYGHGVVNPLAALGDEVDMSGAAPVPFARAGAPAWATLPMTSAVVEPKPVWTRWDIWVASGLAIVAAMLLVMGTWRGRRGLRLAALGLAGLTLGMAATGTAVTITRTNDPPVTAVAWPEFATPPSTQDRPYQAVCEHAANEMGLVLELFMDPTYALDADANNVCEVRFPSIGAGSDPQAAAKAVGMRITWQPAVDGEPSNALLGCPDGAGVWSAAAVPVCTQDTPMPDYDTYSVSRFLTRQTWITIEIVEEIRLERLDYVHRVLTLVVPVIVEGTRRA